MNLLQRKLKPKQSRERNRPLTYQQAYHGLSRTKIKLKAKKKIKMSKVVGITMRYTSKKFDVCKVMRDKQIS